MNLEKSVLDMFEGLSKVDFNVVVEYTGILFVIFWLVVVIWVWFDCKERTESFFLRILATIIVLVGLIPGLIIYLILRPKMTVSEQYWSDLERRYLMYETAELQDCEKCGNMLQPGFVFCPVCRETVKVKCEGCGVNIDKRWKNCPFCGVEHVNAVESATKVVRYESFSEFLSRGYREIKQKVAEVKPVPKMPVNPQVTNVVTTTEKHGKKRKKKNRKNKK